MAMYQAVPFGAQAAAGADLTALVGVIEPQDGQGNGVDRMVVTAPAGVTVTGAATNNVQVAVRQLRGGSPVGALAAPAGLTATAVATGGTFAAATYFWKVTATNATGETLASAEASVAIALNGSANLSWTAVTGATGYRVYRSTTTGGQSTSPAFVAATTATTYTDTGTAATAGAVPAANTTSVIGTLVLTSGVNLTPENPVNIPVSNPPVLQVGDVLDAVLHQNGSGLAVGAGVAVEVTVN